MLQVLNMIGKVRIKFKVEVIDNACLVARAAHLMTHGEFAEGYSLIRDMQGKDYLTSEKSIKGRNLNRSRYYSRERLKKAMKRQYPCSLLVPWNGGFEN